MYIVPPMDDQPPRDFLDFVAVHLAGCAARGGLLVSGSEHADEIYPAAFSDVAIRWRRLRLQRGSAGDAGRRGAYLAASGGPAKQWRDDQIYEVEVQCSARRSAAAAPPHRAAKAAVCRHRTRHGARRSAEASIAWTTRGGGPMAPGRRESWRCSCVLIA
jgi:hypothetical protein